MSKTRTLNNTRSRGTRKKGPPYVASLFKALDAGGNDKR